MHDGDGDGANMSTASLGKLVHTSVGKAQYFPIALGLVCEHSPSEAAVTSCPAKRARAVSCRPAARGSTACSAVATYALSRSNCYEDIAVALSQVAQRQGDRIAFQIEQSCLSAPTSFHDVMLTDCT
jgi:hypothetical protein